MIESKTYWLRNKSDILNDILNHYVEVMDTDIIVDMTSSDEWYIKVCFEI